MSFPINLLASRTTHSSRYKKIKSLEGQDQEELVKSDTPDFNRELRQLEKKIKKAGGGNVADDDTKSKEDREREKNERKKKETSGGETEESRESTALYGRGLRESEGGPLVRPTTLRKVKWRRCRLQMETNREVRQQWTSSGQQPTTSSATVRG